MNYAEVQASLESFVQSNWATTAIQFNNVAFLADAYSQYVRCNVIFGDAEQRTVTSGCYRQFGLLVLTAFARPNTGSEAVLNLANALSSLVRSVIVPPSGGAPAVQLKVPDLFTDFRERDGWIQAQVSCPFYYDI